MCNIPIKTYTKKDVRDYIKEVLKKSDKYVEIQVLIEDMQTRLPSTNMGVTPIFYLLEEPINKEECSKLISLELGRKWECVANTKNKLKFHRIFNSVTIYTRWWDNVFESYDTFEYTISQDKYTTIVSSNYDNSCSILLSDLSEIFGRDEEITSFEFN